MLIINIKYYWFSLFVVWLLSEYRHI